MSNLKNGVHVTPDYSVPTNLKSKRVPNREVSLEEALVMHEKFVAFREGIRELGFLPADANFDDEVSFLPPEGRETRAITYRIATISRFLNSPSAKASRTTSYGYTPEAPEITIFQANLLRPVVFGFSATNSEAFKFGFSKLISTVGYSEMLVNGVPYDRTIELLKIVKEYFANELITKNIPVTNKNIIRLMSLSRFVERGHSYLKGLGSYGPGTVPEPLKDYIYELIRLDVKLYHGLVALSPEANKHDVPVTMWSIRPEASGRPFPLPKHDPNVFVELNEIPEYYLQRLIAPVVEK
jgi:hypothetical protein